VGSLCLIFAVIFLIAYLKKKNTRREEWVTLSIKCYE
jgi:hypothetical protein